MLFAPEISLGDVIYADSSLINQDQSEKYPWIDRADYYEKTQNYDSVEICLRLAIKDLSSSSEPAVIKLGSVWFRLGDLYHKHSLLEDAVYCYDTVIKLSILNRWESDDFFWKSQWNIGAVYASQSPQNWESAKLAYEDARNSIRRLEGSTSRRNSILTSSIALCYSKLGYFREAEELYE